MDDIGEEEGERQLEETRKVLFSIIEQLYNQLHQDIDLTNPEVAIIGQPNAGKSTLFNKILKTERSIVSKTAGTTRDYISEKIRINNTIYSIFDTAGIRTTDDSIEEKGIELALDRVKNSFYKILVINPFETSEAYFSKIQNLNFDQIIFTHKDLKGFDKHKKDILQIYISIFGPMGASSLNGPTGADSKIGPIEPVISEFSPEINDLSFVTDRISDKFSKFSKQEILNIDRHKFEISNIYKQYLEYLQLAENTNDISIISSELNIVGNCISRLIGIISPDEVLHNIFSNFCIGK
jgi:tRNA modification GTPase